MNYKDYFSPPQNQIDNWNNFLNNEFDKLKNKYVNAMKREELGEAIINLSSLPLVFRYLGYESGELRFTTKAIKHSIDKHVNGSNAALNKDDYKALLDIIYNPDLITRSNTEPNKTLLFFKENSGSVYLLPCHVENGNLIKAKENVSFEVQSLYKKDNQTTFFNDLFNYGFVLYTSGESKFFDQFIDVKKNPLPRSMATDTPLSGFSAIAPYIGSFKYKIVDKRKIVKSLEENNKVGIFLDDYKKTTKMKKELSSLGYSVTIVKNRGLETFKHLHGLNLNSFVTEKEHIPICIKGFTDNNLKIENIFSYEDIDITTEINKVQESFKTLNYCRNNKTSNIEIVNKKNKAPSGPDKGTKI